MRPYSAFLQRKRKSIERLTCIQLNGNAGLLTPNVCIDAHLCDTLNVTWL